MITKNMPWFRMYTDFLNDPKMISIAFEDQRHFIGLLALKGDGTLDNACAPDLMNRIISQRLWVDYAVIGEVKKRLIAANLIGDDWQPLAWDRRQMRSDADLTGAERQRRFKERKRAETSVADDNSGNGDGNALPDALPDALPNAEVTPPDTDTDTEEEGEKKNKGETRPRKRGADSSSTLGIKELSTEGVIRQIASDWLTLRKAKRLPLTPTAWQDLKDEAAKCGMTPADAVAHAVKSNWAGFKAKWIVPGDHGGDRAAIGMNKQESLEARNREIARRATEKFMAQNGAAA